MLGTDTRTHGRIRVHRTLCLEPREVARRRGVPVTAPPRTTVDLAGSLAYGPLAARFGRPKPASG